MGEALRQEVAATQIKVTLIEPGMVDTPFFDNPVSGGLQAEDIARAVLYALGALCMILLSRVTTFPQVFGLLLAFCLCYFPTIALSNSIAMQQVKNPGRDFPPIRVMGTLGWIAVNLVIGFMAVEAQNTPFLIAAGACIAMCLYSLVALPHTPPPARGQQVTFSRIVGLDALAMLKDRSYLVFVIASILACIPLTFYYSFTNPFLNDVGVVNAAGKMTLGQASEVAMMLAMPIAFRILNVRGILLLGLSAWAIRYVLLAFGNPGSGMWMFYIAILLHGLCYDFFFVAGQLYTDQAAPAHLRSTAQGFITFVTYGIGMLIGSLLSGSILDYFSTTTETGAVVRNWQSFWLSSAAMSFVITLLVLFFFKSKARVGTETTQAAA